MIDDHTDRLGRAKAGVGTVLLGKYRLDRVLGVGGMAVVYAATHRNRQTFAIKILHAELSVEPEIRTRFLREGYVANSVQHKGAVKVFDDDVAEDGAAFLVIELLDGAPVDRVLERCGLSLPPAAVLALAHQLLDVLAAAHANAVVHRDIKPANLFLTRQGTVKVLDFGIARLRERAEQTGVTQAGLLGTPVFMGPEQAIGHPQDIDGRSDLWSVGATLFTLLSSATVHEGRTPQEVVVHAATRPARSLATVAPDLSPDIVALVDRALAFRKEDRWSSAAEMRDAVRDLYLAEFSAIVSEAPLLALFEGSRMSRTAVSGAATIPSTPPGDPLSFVGDAQRTPTPVSRARASGASGPAGATRTYSPATRTNPEAQAPRPGWVFWARVGLGTIALTGGGLIVARAVRGPGVVSTGPTASQPSQTTTPSGATMRGAALATGTVSLGPIDGPATTSWLDANGPAVTLERNATPDASPVLSKRDSTSGKGIVQGGGGHKDAAATVTTAAVTATAHRNPLDMIVQ